MGLCKTLRNLSHQLILQLGMGCQVERGGGGGGCAEEVSITVSRSQTCNLKLIAFLNPKMHSEEGKRKGARTAKALKCRPTSNQSDPWDQTLFH